MNKVIMLGDIHGKYEPIKAIVEKNNFNQDDVLILLGDIGANFFFNYRDKKFKEKLNKCGMTIFAIRGNHEERPSVCMEKAPDEWHTEIFWKNIVYVENNYPNIKYALDCPADYRIPTPYGVELTTLVLPGAYSVDKYHRIENGWSWFEGEQLDEEEMLVGNELAHKTYYSLILSHTCPLCYEPTDLFLSFIDQSTVDKTMERWLGKIEYDLDYDYGLWCWGHYHSNRIYPSGKQLMLFNNCYLDVFKYFENNKLIDCLVKTNEFADITDLSTKNN